MAFSVPIKCNFAVFGCQNQDPKFSGFFLIMANSSFSHDLVFSFLATYFYDQLSKVMEKTKSHLGELSAKDADQQRKAVFQEIISINKIDIAGPSARAPTEVGPEERAP